MGDDCLDISYEPLVFGSHSLSVCLARGFQENWNSLGYDLFLLPLVSGSHLFGVGVQDYGLFWDMISGNAVSSASWFDSGYMLLPVYGFWCIFPYSLQCLVLSGPRYAPVTEFTSLISLSWCRGRCPWSCCSADHSNSPVAVLGQGDRWPCCAGRDGFLM